MRGQREREVRRAACAPSSSSIRALRMRRSRVSRAHAGASITFARVAGAFPTTNAEPLWLLDPDDTGTSEDVRWTARCFLRAQAPASELCHGDPPCAVAWDQHRLTKSVRALARFHTFGPPEQLDIDHPLRPLLPNPLLVCSTTRPFASGRTSLLRSATRAYRRPAVTRSSVAWQPSAATGVQQIQILRPAGGLLRLRSRRAAPWPLEEICSPHRLAVGRRRLRSNLLAVEQQGVVWKRAGSLRSP